MIIEKNSKAEISFKPNRDKECEKIKKLIVASRELERQRISRELHDELGQYVSTIRFGLESIISTLPAKAAEEADKLAQLFTVVDKLDREVSYFSYALRSPVENEEVKDIVTSFVREWERRSGVPVNLTFIGTDDDLLDYEIKNAIYRLIQEALTNVTKHAGAIRVSIFLQIDRGGATLMIEDDGRGFDVNKNHRYSNGKTSLGLVGMRERVDTVGGTLNIESIPGIGTVITVIIPIPSN